MSAIDVGRRRSHRGPCRSLVQRTLRSSRRHSGPGISSTYLPGHGIFRSPRHKSPIVGGRAVREVRRWSGSRVSTSAGREQHGSHDGHHRIEIAVELVAQTIRDGPKARAVAAIRPARTIEMTAVDISVVMYRVRCFHQLPLPAGALVIVYRAPERSRNGRSVLSDVANSQEAAWSLTVSDDGPNGGHAEGGA